MNFRSNMTEADKLSKLLGEPKRNARHDIWLWLHLYLTKKAPLDPGTCSGQTMRDEIAYFLGKNEYMLSSIAREKDLSLIPAELLTADFGERDRSFR